jgi:triacylglycerol esterase/lipase EstA (alpha/beta hydrolase family)
MHTSTSGFVHDPVIMIPGMTGSTSSMDVMQKALMANGWPLSILFKWTDSSQMTQDLASAAQELSIKVDQVLAETGAFKVILATWSASALAARYYIKNLRGDIKVSQYIAFAGPQHGTTNNACQQYVACQQFGDADSAFLSELNSTTEVPGNRTIKYLTLRSTNDMNVLPTDSAMLSGADENYLISGEYAPNHYTIVAHQVALNKMIAFIKQNERATP